MKKILSLFATMALSSACGSQILAAEEKEATAKEDQQSPEKPNILIFYVDDLGYGDVGCYGATGVETPNVDQLASEGMRFTDAHCSAATSTPSRYALLTGSYAFRGGARILPGDAPLLIDTDQKTLPSMLQQAGYATGIVGKWHLGLGDGNINWNEAVKPGPLEVGFDYSYIIPATGDRVPCVWLENHHVANLDPEDPIRISYGEKIGDEPTGLSHPELLRVKADRHHSSTIINGVGRIGYMAGGHTARWEDELFAWEKLWKAREFMDRNKDKPFFLYFSLHDIHDPHLPNQKFVGQSDMGPRGDAIVQMDWMLGEIMKKLEKMGKKENTMVIFTSDNGPVLHDGYVDHGEEMVGDHKPAGPFSGGKYSALEAGTRVPMIVSWPGVIEPGTSDALVGQVDLLASLARLTGQSLQGQEAPDSYNLLPTLTGKSSEGRGHLVEESWTLGLRQGNWKYIEPGQEPGWVRDSKHIDPGGSSQPQLYNLDKDMGEKHNVAEQHPDRVQQMQNMLDQIREQGYSRPGID